ncbi:MAG: MiaB/RimO family radical SAM methylthiotransferase, partial [Candidatus Omnitrophota bacterium]
DNRAYVSIMRGCNNFCSYCIVPYVRGRERSRKVESIVSEVKELIKKGIKNITLLGQNVNSYNEIASLRALRPVGPEASAPLAPPRNDEEFKPCDFVQLLGLVNNISGIGKISFMTSHPKDAGVELFEAIRDLDHVVKHLHLPLQSGSDKILKLMKRGYTSGEYLEKVKKAQKIIPKVRLTTDIIVGFPGETEEDFKATFDMLKEIEFNFSYIFKYSPRSGTAASKYQDDVTREIKNKRHRILLDMQKEISIRKNK